MAIWAIPNDYVIEYVKGGDDIASFSQKVKYLLEEIFFSLQELHTAVGEVSVTANSFEQLPIAISNPQDGEILVYHAATQNFRNQPNAAVGEGKSLIFCNGGDTLGDYNGSATTTIDFNIALGDMTNSAKDTEHLKRLVENLYLVLDVAGLNPGGYDNLSGETFYGTIKDLDATRSSGTIADGKFFGDGATFVTNPIPFVNEVTGEMRSISRAHLVIKHQNVADAEITAELALRDAAFVKGEVLAIGTGNQQTVTLAHTSGLTGYKFALYFDGVAQENFSFNASTGQVTFAAQSGVIVTADYFYNFGAENFVQMTKTGTYPDRRNPARASTQFTFSGAAGKVATLRLTLRQGAGTSTANATGTGSAQGIKLAHQAVSNSIQVTPSNYSWTYNENQNIVIVTAPLGVAIGIDYQWRGKSFTVDSFACTFDE